MCQTGKVQAVPNNAPVVCVPSAGQTTRKRSYLWGCTGAGQRPLRGDHGRDRAGAERWGALLQGVPHGKGQNNTRAASSFSVKQTQRPNTDTRNVSFLWKKHFKHCLIRNTLLALEFSVCLQYNKYSHG